tara:strand:+ start:31077 stop:32291 length:1215 start_codon:yes stop_codon:yes gene_type:complete
MKIRKLLYPNEAAELKLKVKANEPFRKQAKYYIEEEDYQAILKERETPRERKFVNTQNKLDKNGEIVSTLEKLQAEPIPIPDNFEVIKISTSKTTGQQWVQYAAKDGAEIKELDFEAIIKKHIEPIKQVVVPVLDKAKDFDRLVITDVHVGMETDKYNNSMYAVKWNREEVLKDADLIVKKTIQEKESNLLIIDDYGDLMDGFDGKTTRGGHELPQNMTNEEAFDCAVEFKLRMIEPLINNYERVEVNNICNDNHSGAFGYFVNKTIKDILELKYKNVKVTNHRKFINHYFIGDICFVISHGKDDKSLKFGFKPHLKPDSIEKIDQYCKNNKIYKNSELVIFCKGDSHQALFDMCGSDDFYYFNYPALSPSSQWVQNNFKKGRRGFFLESFRNLDIYLKPKFIR